MPRRIARKEEAPPSMTISTCASPPSRGGGAAMMFASVGLAQQSQINKFEHFVKTKFAAAGASLRQRALRSPLFAHAGTSMTASATATMTSMTVSRIADVSAKDVYPPHPPSPQARFNIDKNKKKLRPASDAELEAAFNRVDKNKSGDIDRDELQAACASLGGEGEGEPFFSFHPTFLFATHPPCDLREHILNMVN